MPFQILESPQSEMYDLQKSVNITVPNVFECIFDRLPQLTAQISENLGEDERLVQGLCALLLGICIYYNDNSLENYTK